MRIGVVPALLLLLASHAGIADAANLILRGGAIYTLDEKRPWASAVVIEAGRIAYVGDDAGAAALERSGTRTIDLRGRMVLPGFHDAHAHPMSGGMRLLRCPLGGLAEAQVYAAVRRCAAESRDKPWLLGGGWTDKTFAAGGPSRAKLDELVPDRPAFFMSEDGFRGWANSKALQLAGVSSEGAVEGDVNLKVRGDAAPPTQAELREALRRSSAMANRFGVTSMFDALAAPALLEAYRAADAAGELTVRVVAAQAVAPGRGAAQVDDMIARRDEFRGARFRPEAAKLFLDGEIVDHTAALVEPYADRPGSRGQLLLSDAALRTIVRRLDAEGFLVHMHAMGDGAVRAGLDFLEDARRRNGDRARRHQIAHLGVVHPDDIPRFARLGVAANITPVWARADDPAADRTRRALGEARARWMLPFASLAASGARITASSDWPSPSLNPLEGIQAAVTREPREERMTLADILAAYTRNAAWAVRAEETVGTIEAGKAADLVVLERNLFEVEASRLSGVRVLLTLLEGEPVYRAQDFAWPGIDQRPPATSSKAPVQ